MEYSGTGGLIMRTVFEEQENMRIICSIIQDAGWPKNEDKSLRDAYAAYLIATPCSKYKWGGGSNHMSYENFLREKDLVNKYMPEIKST